eukprot:COSAG04_NODE_4759_length_1906_cov_4.581546_3_plen_104_part_00
MNFSVVSFRVTWPPLSMRAVVLRFAAIRTQGRAGGMAWRSPPASSGDGSASYAEAWAVAAYGLYALLALCVVAFSLSVPAIRALVSALRCPCCPHQAACCGRR